jgi:AraC family transcriptional regulator of adaptative response / DNA-3-methyladenine glycosylase II
MASAQSAARVKPDDEQLYQRFLQRDRIWDGQFLTGVLSTGIYCLPSCPARRPLRKNVRFFKTPEEARSSGLRPCHRCRPDWFYRGEEWHESLFEQTAARVRRNPAAFSDVAAVARAAGLSRTALNDLFREHAHESPGSFLRGARVEHARSLMEAGKRPGEAASSAGFESTSSFHEQFPARTGLTPGAYAGLTQSREFVLRLPPGYRFREVLDFYGRDPLSVSECIFDDGFRKALTIGERPALIEVRFENGAARCRTDAANIFAAHRAVVRTLGIDSDAAAFERQFADDPLLGSLIRRRKGLRIPLTPEPWEAIAWAIMGQQISLGAAVALRRQLIGAFGAKHAGGLYAHPTAAVVAEVNAGDLRKLQFSRSKAEYLIAAARAIATGNPALGSLRELSAPHAARLLRSIRGIGPWTVQYAFLRGFGFADCLPSGDAGLARGLERLTGKRPVETEIRGTMERFAPWRSLATYHIWASLKDGNDAV